MAQPHDLHPPHQPDASPTEETGKEASFSKASIPDVVLLNQHGERVRFYSDLVKNKVVAINFIFTTCTTICPPMGAHFSKLQELMGERLGKDVHLISISVDPVTDTPQRLEAWGEKFNVGPGWTLLTGPKHDVVKLLKTLGVFTADKWEHTPIVLIGNEATGQWVRADGLTPPAKLAEIITDLIGLAASSVDPLTAAEKRGKHIYLRGTSPSGQGITALLGKAGTEVPASVLRCASCHGHDGRGKPEGGVVPSNITWEALTKPYGITHPSGRHHPPYTEQLLKRAITQGIDPAGNELHAAMPRFQMSHQDLTDLITYLKQLGKSLDPGLTETTIEVGTILPPTRRLAGMSRAVRAVLEAYFDEVNQAGGIYTRRVIPRFAEALDPPEEGIKAVRAFLENGRIFALTGSFMADADEEIASLVQDQAIPLVGAFTLDPQLGSPLNRYVFYLDSGLKGQGRALAAFAARQYAVKNPPAAIIHADEKTAHAVAQAIRAECQRSGWDAVEEPVVPHGQFNAATLVRTLREKATEIVFFLGPSAAASVFLQQAQSLDWQPLFFVPGSLAGSELFTVPIGLEGRIFLAFPTLPSDQTPDGVAEYRRLAKARKLPSQHLAAQLTALSSAKILVEGLKRAGRDVNREKLIEVLEGLYEFKTGFIPAVTYGPNRRVGALGAYIISLDLEAKRFVPVGEWIELN